MVESNLTPENFQNWRIVPEGEYTAIITATDKREFQDGNQYLAIEWQICDANMNGRRVKQNLYIYTEGDKLMKEKNKLANIVRACGFNHETYENSLQLHDIPVKIGVSVYNNKNYIKFVESLVAGTDDETGAPGDTPFE